MTGGDARLVSLAERFEQQYGRRPQVAARAPGRVNLIGEHTDYNGLPVLPMAVDRTVLVAGAARDDQHIELANVDAAFPARSYELAPVITPFPPGDWGNYHKAAVQGLVSLLRPAALGGGDFLVAGNIPVGAGLSSSSALLVASALAMLAVHERSLPAAALADLMASAEQYVGTLSGGMDQAVCLLARAGHALRIDFDPLRTRRVPIAAGGVIVVCDSLVIAEKSGSARAAYNQRVVECRLACRVLAHALGVERPQGLTHFGDLRRVFPGRPFDEYLAVLERHLPPHPLRLGEIAALVGLPADALAALVGVTDPSGGPYLLLPRARHVLTEADRVDRAETALRRADWSGLGALMDASHASCRDDYAVSCPELDRLVAAAKRAGALGARLTGAGFGGCTVNLVPAETVPSFLAGIGRDYYAKRIGAAGGEHVYVFSPGDGASTHRL